MLEACQVSVMHETALISNSNRYLDLAPIPTARAIAEAWRDNRTINHLFIDQDG
jgi:hypothetical protein